MQNREIEQMRAEDKRYGEKLQNRKHVPMKKAKNQPNLARMNMEELMAMEEDEMLEVCH
jgi:hypothetical protein